MKQSRRTMRLLAAAALLLAAQAAQGAPRAERWPYWEAHDAHSTTQLTHAAWGRFLADYLQRDAQGLQRVRYAAVSGAARAALQAYVTELAGLRVTGLTRAEQFAYWVNLYNALTVREVLAAYPVASIRDIGGGWFSSGPWRERLISVEGQALSLDDIEHRILRPIWRDPRIHYAVNCASVGCPNLQPQPFTAENSEALLERAAHDYVNSPRGVAFRDDGRLIVSRIYDWYRADFGDSEAGVLAHLARYAEPELAARLAARNAIDGYAYDWALNAAP